MNEPRRIPKFPPPPTVTAAVLFSKVWEGVYAVGHDGRPLTLAIVDSAGKVIESGEAVSRDAWMRALDSYWLHLKEIGVLHDYGSTPPLQPWHKKKAARAA
ncbi:hypothetical protein HDG36_001932 [Paraburkholderia sp. Kb1A]|uniref:hypothetical protein n=1 Tax=unclassified Paraburkholderia TaxID=2615204 RepID=UPI001620B3FB|nr:MULTISPECIES: hypothetical protein [unclassified Paraburkholderia]MBB5450396.1 hypothetical protein [Paraburkholderia sp. Kb1A]